MTVPGGKYVHYKGPQYRAQGTARHSETGEDFVVYETLYKSDGGRMWIRPKDMFEEKVEINGQNQDRFAYQEKEVEDPVVRQLTAYNDKDVETFCSCYTEDVEVHALGGKILFSGQEKLRQSYADLFSLYPNISCQVDRRLVLSNKVIDEQILMGHPQGEFVKVIAIYQIDEGKISKIWFMT